MAKFIHHFFSRWYKLPASQQVGLPDANEHSQTQVFSYGENLLEHSHKQWQFGDWESLVKLDSHGLQVHQDRANLALLAAAAHAQLGDMQSARKLGQLAQEWGCSADLISRIFIAGVYTSLGRAMTIIDSHGEKALNFFKKAVAIGSSKNGVEFVSEQTEEYMLYGDKTFISAASIKSIKKQYPIDLCLHGHINNHFKIEFYNYKDLTHDFLLETSKIIKVGNENEVKVALKKIAYAIQNIVKDANCLDLTVTDFAILGQHVKLVHVEKDHIPKVVRETNNFYESKYLSQLATFYKPKGIVVDCGANIGNHTIYFAKFCKARVLAYEPVPHNAVCLAVNVALNNVLPQVDMMKHGLGIAPGAVSLQKTVADNFGSFSAVYEILPARNEISESLCVNIFITSLDDSLKQLEINSNIAIFKIDAEGMEHDILRGALKTIEESLPVVGVECVKQSDFPIVENILRPYSYFPIEVLNWTPTFIFISRKNPWHMHKLTEHLRMATVVNRLKKNTVHD